MTNPLRWGILSTGTIANAFAGALGASTHNNLHAVGSRSQASADAFAGQYPGTQSYASYGALLSDPDVDAVYIATPHPAHANWVVRALEAGKHVLCEKPLGVNHAEVMAMVHAAKVNERFLMEAFMYRCHPQTQAIKQAIDAGRIGDVRHIEASFGFQVPVMPEHRLFSNELAGGGIMDVGCYPLSMCRWLLSAEPEKISGQGHLGSTGVDEWATAQLNFANDVSAHIATGVTQEFSNHVVVHGSAGKIIISSPWHCSNPDGHWGFQLRLPGQEQPERIEGRTGNIYTLEADHVAQCVRLGLTESPLVSLQDSLANAHGLDTWRRSIGLEFDRESPAAHQGPITGSLRPASNKPIAHRNIKELTKPISQLVMGCDNQPSISHASVMWDHYFERGGNTFDTAHIYGDGRMETLFGHWHHQRSVREDVVIIGKGAHSPDCYPQAIAQQLDISLDRLQSDYVDIYFMHRDNLDVPVGEFVEALNAELNRGRVHMFGGSNWTLSRLQEANAYAAAKGLTGFTAVSNNFSLAQMVEPIWPGTETAGSDEFRQFLTDTQTALFPWSSQARGFFTQWAEDVRQSTSQRGQRGAAITSVQPTALELQRTWFSPENFARRERAEQLAQERGVPLINVALAYVSQQPFPCFPLIGPRLLEETDSCIDSLAVSLSEQDLVFLDRG